MQGKGGTAVVGSLVPNGLGSRWLLDAGKIEQLG